MLYNNFIIPNDFILHLDIFNRFNINLGFINTRAR